MMQQVTFKHQRRQMVTTEEGLRVNASLPKHSMTNMEAAVPPKTKRRSKYTDEVVGAEPNEFVAETRSGPTSGGPKEGGPASAGTVRRGRGRPRGSVNKNKLDRMSNQASSSTVSNESSTKTSPSNSRGHGRGRGRGSGVAGSQRGSRGGRGSIGRPHFGRSVSPKKEKPPKVPIKKQKPPPVEVFDEETRMSADLIPMPTPAPQEPVDNVTSTGTSVLPVVQDEGSQVSHAGNLGLAVASVPSTDISVLPDVQDEDSQLSQASNMSSTSASTSGLRKIKKFSKDLVIEERVPVTAETIFEYQWPQNDANAEYFFLQEQISEFVGVKSFRRRYPELRRRVVDREEREFLRSQKAVTSTQCDLGLTAINSCDVLDILFKDFVVAYEDYRRVVQERKGNEMAKMKAAPTPVGRDKSAEFMRRIQKSCSKWNARLNKDRKEKRPCVYDLQTGTINFPAGKYLTLPPAATKMGGYPVTVVPGQFCDNFKQYTPNELKYFPLNTVMYGPVLPVHDNEEAFDIDETDESGTNSDKTSCSEESSSDDCSKIQECESELSDEDSGITKNEASEVCKTCKRSALKNKDRKSEVLVRCANCHFLYHPTCLDLTLDMVSHIQKYDWQCSDCKSCVACKESINEDKMMFCDCCDRGYHIYCVGLRKIPVGRWHCELCRDCQSRRDNAPSADDTLTELQHELSEKRKRKVSFLTSQL